MNCILYLYPNWLRRLLYRLRRRSHERLLRVLARNAEWCRQAQEAPPLSAQIQWGTQ